MDIYQHFRKEEQPFIDQTMSLIDYVEKTYQIKVTDFLDPREQKITEILIGTSMEDLRVHKYGGSEDAERKRMVIAPMYEHVTPGAFQVTLLQASYHQKFVTLTHRDVLGAFLSLGIKRKKLGDILVEDGLIQIVVADEIAPFVLMNLETVKNATIKLEEKPLSSMIEKDNNWVTSEQIVSSLRLDVVLKAIYNLSRKKAAEMISKRLVKVNFRVADDRKFTLEAGDIISLSGKGRSRIVQVNGRTRKDNISITTAVLK